MQWKSFACGLGLILLSFLTTTGLRRVLLSTIEAHQKAKCTISQFSISVSDLTKFEKDIGVSSKRSLKIKVHFHYFLYSR